MKMEKFLNLIIFTIGIAAFGSLIGIGFLIIEILERL